MFLTPTQIINRFESLKREEETQLDMCVYGQYLYLIKEDLNLRCWFPNENETDKIKCMSAFAQNTSVVREISNLEIDITDKFCEKRYNTCLRIFRSELRDTIMSISKFTPKIILKYAIVGTFKDELLHISFCPKKSPNMDIIKIEPIKLHSYIGKSGTFSTDVKTFVEVLDFPSEYECVELCFDDIKNPLIVRARNERKYGDKSFGNVMLAKLQVDMALKPIIPNALK